MQSTSNMYSQQQTQSAGSVVPVINVPAQPLLSTMTAATPVVSMARSAAAGQPSPSALQSNNDNGVPLQGAQLSLPSHVIPSVTTVEQAAAAAATSAIQRAQDIVTPPLGTSQNVEYNVNSVLPSGYALAPNSITTTSSSATSNHVMSNIAAQPQWSSLPSSSQQQQPLPSASAAVPIVTPTTSSSLPSSACAPKSNLSLVLRHGGPFTRGPNSLPPTMPDVPRAPPQRPFPPRFRMPAVVQSVQAVPMDEPVVVLSRSRAVGQSMGMSMGQSTQEQAAQTTTTTATAAAGTSGPIDTAAAVMDKASSSKPTGSLSSKQLAAAATVGKEGKVQKGEKAGEQCVLDGTTTTTIKNNALSQQDNGTMKGNDVVATVAPHPKKKKNKQKRQQDMQNDADSGEPLRPTELILDPEEEDNTNTVRVVEQNELNNNNSRSQQRRVRRMQEAYALAAVRRANEFDSPAATGLSQNILAPEQLTDSTTHSENTSDNEEEVHAMRDTVYRRLPFRARTLYGTSPTTDSVMAPPFAHSRSSQSRVERKVSPQAEYTRLPSTEPPHLTGTSSSPHHHRNDAEWNRYRRRYTRRASGDDGGSNASIQAWRATHHHNNNNNYYSSMRPAVRSATPPTLTAESMTARQLLRWRYDGRRYVRDPTTLHNTFHEPQHTPRNEDNAMNGPVRSFPSTPGIVAPPATSLLREDSPRWHASDGPIPRNYTHNISRRYTTRSTSIEDDDDEVAEELYLRRKKYFNDPPLRSPSPRLQQQKQPRYIYTNHRPVNNNEVTYSPRERGKVDTAALPAHIADTLWQRQEPSRTHHHHHYNSTTAREGNNNDNGDASTCVIRVTVMNEAQDGGLAQRPSRVTQDMNNRKRNGYVSRGTSHYDTQDSAAIEMDSHFETGGPCVVVVRLPRKLLRQIKIGHLKRQLERQLGLPAELQQLCAEGVALQDAVPLALLQQPSSLTLHWLTGPSVSQAVGGPGSRNITTSNTPQGSTQGTSLTGQMSRRPSRGFLLLSPPKEGVPSASSTQTTTNTRTTSLVMQQLIRPDSHLHETNAGPLVNIPGRTSSRSLSQLTSPRLHGLMALLPPLPRRASPITRPRKGHRPRTITSKRADASRSATLHREIDAITSDTVSRLSRHGSPMQYTSEDDDEDDKRGRHHSRYSSSSSESGAEEAAPAAVHYSGITAL